jgi:hypothetical protein
VEDMHGKEDKKEDDGKEPWTIAQGDMVNTSPDDIDTMADNPALVLAEECQEMHEHTPRPQPPAPAPWRHIPRASPMITNSRDSSTQCAGVLEIVTPQIP